MTARIKWKWFPNQLFHSNCKHVMPTGSERKRWEVWKPVLTMPPPGSGCVHVFVQAALFFHFLMFLMPSAASPECPSYRRQQLWSRETKGKVAIVTEAMENSYSSLQSSSPMGSGEMPSATQGPPSHGASLPAISLSAVFREVTIFSSM